MHRELREKKACGHRVICNLVTTLCYYPIYNSLTYRGSAYVNELAADFCRHAVAGFCRHEEVCVHLAEAVGSYHRAEAVEAGSYRHAAACVHRGASAHHAEDSYCRAICAHQDAVYDSFQTLLSMLLNQ